MKKTARKNLSNASGLTLLEVAIALAILGVIVAATADLYTRAQQQQKIQITHANMDAITQALSIYAQTAGRVPCPADPSKSDQTFGWEYGVTLANLTIANNTTVGATTISHFPVGSCGTAAEDKAGIGGSGDGASANPTEGIVPFMTLGLSAKTALDGWGHYFTYAVSPVFARHNDQVTAQLTAATPQDYGTVHGRCRHDGWVPGGVPIKNLNPVKARFCCADQLTDALSPHIDSPTYDQNSDLVINFTDNVAPLIQPVPARTGNPSYAGINTETVTANNTPTMDETAVAAPAFILISHGADGYGAYLADNALDRITSGSIVENYNIHPANSPSNTPYVDGPINTATANGQYFDDIVRWMTQDGVMAAHGAVSCQYP